MSCRAKTLGTVGTIVDGRVRDLAEHRAQNYPVWSRDVGIAAGAEVCYSSEINVPVPLRSPEQPDVWVYPGDILVADENGVAAIPRHLEEEVMKAIPQLAERDRLSMQDLLQGLSGEETFKKRRG
jgi:regulator of RNase E activity RraA